MSAVVDLARKFDLGEPITPEALLKAEEADLLALKIHVDEVIAKLAAQISTLWRPRKDYLEPTSPHHHRRPAGTWTRQTYVHNSVYEQQKLKQRLAGQLSQRIQQELGRRRRERRELRSAVPHALELPTQVNDLLYDALHALIAARSEAPVVQQLREFLRW